MFSELFIMPKMDLFCERAKRQQGSCAQVQHSSHQHSSHQHVVSDLIHELLANYFDS